MIDVYLEMGDLELVYEVACRIIGLENCKPSCLDLDGNLMLWVMVSLVREHDLQTCIVMGPNDTCAGVEVIRCGSTTPMAWKCNGEYVVRAVCIAALRALDAGGAGASR